MYQMEQLKQEYDQKDECLIMLKEENDHLKKQVDQLQSVNGKYLELVQKVEQQICHSPSLLFWHCVPNAFGLFDETWRPV